jgi:hypothetical protein
MDIISQEGEEWPWCCATFLTFAKTLQHVCMLSVGFVARFITFHHTLNPKPYLDIQDQACMLNRSGLSSVL